MVFDKSQAKPLAQELPAIEDVYAAVVGVGGPTGL